MSDGYVEPKAGEWVQPTPRGYLMACCDCGLVHTMDFRVIKWAGGKRTKAQFRVWRNEKETKRLRKANNITVRAK